MWMNLLSDLIHEILEISRDLNYFCVTSLDYGKESSQNKFFYRQVADYSNTESKKNGVR